MSPKASKKKARTVASVKAAGRVEREVQDSFDAVQEAVTSPEVVARTAKGAAYISVAQSGAIAVQDAVAYLRSVETVAVAGISVAASRIIETGKLEPYLELIDSLQKTVDTATNQFMTISEDVAKMITQYPVS